ncbi:hypothetical protein [Endozoicomonas sp. ALD040]|uniref:hypothetical protein n=1 Tax=unclassified Endozoicomonas TaxID=2644528 RepID=UPI003BAE5F17
MVEYLICEQGLIDSDNADQCQPCFSTALTGELYKNLIVEREGNDSLLNHGFT